MSKTLFKELWGEFAGTFILVFVGLSSIGMALILGWLDALYQVALVWGFGVFVAVVVAKRWSPAHLNPAVTLAMCIARHHSWRRLLPYSLVQLLAAMSAGLGIYRLFKDDIIRFEKDILGLDAMLYPFIEQHNATTAQMFGEFFPNPAYVDTISMTAPLAMLAEGGATFLLLMGIFIIVKRIDRLTAGSAALIGLLVAVLIWIFAPYTQCGMNPARDLGPRIVAYFAGWESGAVCVSWPMSILVYVVAPFIGATLAALVARRWI